jgi:hypothetical protein
MNTKELIEDAKAAGFEDYFHEANVNTSARLKLETRLAKFAELQRQRERQAVPAIALLHDLSADLLYIRNNLASKVHDTSWQIWLDKRIAAAEAVLAAAPSPEQGQAVPSGYLYEEISGTKGYFIGPLHENTKWQVDHNDLKLTPFWFAAPSPELISPHPIVEELTKE